MNGTGGLSDLVAFEEPSTVEGDYGATAGAWTERFRRLVAIENMRGTEPVDAQRLVGVNPVVIRVRASTAVTAVTSAWRLRHVLTGTLYNIRSVVPKPDREWVQLFCETGVANNA